MRGSGAPSPALRCGPEAAPDCDSESIMGNGVDYLRSAQAAAPARTMPEWASVGKARVCEHRMPRRSFWPVSAALAEKGQTARKSARSISFAEAKDPGHALLFH